MIKQRPTQLTQVCVLFISYIAILQVLYALQTVLVSVPFVAIISTLYFLLLQRRRALPMKEWESSFLLLPPSSGSNSKASSTPEEDLQHLLIQQTEEVLQTNLQHFEKVNLSILLSSRDGHAAALLPESDAHQQ